MILTLINFKVKNYKKDLKCYNFTKIDFEV